MRSSKETTRFDEENQAFLTADCGRLQVPFTSPHSLSVNGSSGISPGKTIRSRSVVLRQEVPIHRRLRQWPQLNIDTARSSQLF